MFKRITAFLLFPGLLLISIQAETKLQLASPFADNMVLQRQMSVPIWGWAEQGAGVTVNFAGQSVSAEADSDGKWTVKLKPLKGSAENRQLTVSCGKETIICNDVVVGEVWLVSGQSNMDWLASKSNCRELASKISKEKPPIREYLVDTGSAVFPRRLTKSTSGWKKSDQASDFSAIALSFSWSLHKELKVPVGLLRSTHGATQIETWTAYEGFASHQQLQDIAEKIRRSDPSSAEGRKAFAKYYADLQKWQKDSEEIMNRGGTPLPRPSLPGICEEWRGPSRMFNMKIYPLIPYALRGAIWNQGEHNSGDGRIYASKMEALINGWRQLWDQPEMPFYFTQMQCYGEPDPDNIGFADIREAQTLFLKRNKNVGMALQYDFNPANPRGIHNYNKLDPGRRLARWALANDYGKDIPYTGPIYKSHKISGSKVLVSFEQPGKGGGLMVGSKGQEKDKENYVEPAVRTEGKLQHFRLAGKDRVWHDAEAVIEDGKVVVTSANVSSPVGVQYAYSNSPIGANLYNEVGLPAVPFAYFDGKQVFKEDDKELVAREKADAERKWGKKVYLMPSTLFRNGVVLQRDIAVPVWGHGIPGSAITVTFAGQTKMAKVNEFERWSLKLDALKANGTGRDLIIRSSADEEITIRDVVVGDVWILAGARSQTGAMRLAKGANTPKALSNVREFRQRTNARRFRIPRLKRMEIGGGKYESSWQVADFDDRVHWPSELAYYFAGKLNADIPIGIVNLGADNPPLTWVSHKALQTARGFEKERDELNLLHPNTEVCKKAVTDYIKAMKVYCGKLQKYKSLELIPDELAVSLPAFPQPKEDKWAKRVETATKTYNFCISPLIPYGFKGLVWIPGKDNISSDVSKYSPALKVFAETLAETFGQSEAVFLYAQPDKSLVEGITEPEISGAKKISLSQWPKSLKELAGKFGALAAEE